MKKVIVAIITCLLIITYMMPVNAFAFNNSDKVILIDPGHGGIDGGAKSKAGTIEKDINLQISLKLRDNLEEKGYNVTDISTYKGEQEDYTRIVVYKEGLGYDIKEDLYPDAQIIVDTDGEYLSGDADILVILGSGDSSSDISDTEEDDEY